MKRIENKDFNKEIDVYSGIKDSFGNACLLLVNGDLKELRIVSKNKDYKKERKHLDSIKCSYVYTPKYGEVINISRNTMVKIMEEFPGYKHTEWIVM